jgi:hypothetical protein
MLDLDKRYIESVINDREIYFKNEPSIAYVWKIIIETPEYIKYVTWPELREALTLLDLTVGSFTDSITQEFIDSARYNYISLATVVYYGKVPMDMDWFHILPTCPRDTLRGMLPLYRYKRCILGPTDLELSYEIVERIIGETRGDPGILDILSVTIYHIDERIQITIDALNPEWIYQNKNFEWNYSLIPNTIRLYPDLIQFDQKISQLKQRLSQCVTLNEKYDILCDIPIDELLIIIIQLLE